MLDLKWMTENRDAAELSLKSRRADFDLSQVWSLNDKRKKLQAEYDDLRSLQNQKSKEIALFKKEGKDASGVLLEMQSVAEQVKSIATEQSNVELELKLFLQTLPNFPDMSVPVGEDASQNKIVKTWGQPQEKNFKALEHWQIGENLKMLDFERAAKIAGARFCVSFGALAKLERVLIQFMLNEQTSRGYTEVITPFLVNAETLTGTGQLPKFEDDLFKTTSGYYLIPTAEVPLTNIFRDETLSTEVLPKHFCAYSPCFRSEAGSYGKDMKGLIRQHQFNKVELVKICRPENSEAEHEAMTHDAELILEKLELPYRRVLLCTGDMGFGATKTYDLEVWLPGQKAYREISSCSNCGDFQARRMNTRFKDSDGKLKFVHTLNGSGLAVGRTMIAILENYQNEDGSVTVPEALKALMGCDVIR